MWIGSFRILLNICLLVEIHISEILYCMTFVLNFFIRAASCSTVLSFFFPFSNIMERNNVSFNAGFSLMSELP